MDKSTAYNVLGLQEGATEEQIKEAYRELAKKYNGDNYGDTSPLHDEATKKMDELNIAFDTLMSYIRTGGPAAKETTPNNPYDTGYTQNDNTYTQTGNDNIGRYPAIRNLINMGQADEALAELNAIPYGSSDAEWNFLMGSAYYYKGWLEKALQYFQIACQMDPNNREYQAALRNLTGSAAGNMPGSPFSTQDPNAAAVNCACNTCSCLLCMNLCCGR